MKKLLSLVLAVVLLLACQMPVFAESQKEYDAMKAAAHFADYFFEGFTLDYVAQKVSNDWVDTQSPDFNTDKQTMPVAIDQLDVYLENNFKMDAAMLADVKEMLGYDEAIGIYHVPFRGGFGGFSAAREFVGFTRNADKTYSFYYQTINYDVLPDEVLDPYRENDNWPEEIEYEGKVYVNGIDGYVCRLGFKDGGLVHTLDIKNNTPRFISSAKYTDSQRPKTFDKEPNATTTKKPTTTTKKPVATTEATVTTTTETTGTTAPTKPTETVLETEEIVVTGEKDVFPENTVVAIEKVEEGQATFETVKSALQTVAKKFVAYDITAKKDNVTVQPSGTVTATFEVPADFDLDKTVVYFVADGGSRQLLDSSVDPKSGTVTAVLPHFSTYVVAEKIPGADEPTTTTTAAATTTTAANGDPAPQDFPWTIVVIAVAAVAVAAVVIVLLLLRKKQ